MSRGILYIAHNCRRCSVEFLCSFKSLRDSGYKGKVCVFTDDEWLINRPEIKNVIIKDSKLFCSSLRFPRTLYFLQSPFKTTLHLDTDTIITNRINSIWKYSKDCLLSVVYDKYSLPPTANSGVMLWNRTEESILLFKKWLELNSKSDENDDSFLGWLLAEEKLTINNLPVQFHWTENLTLDRIIPEEKTKIVIQHYYGDKYGNPKNFFGDYWEELRLDAGLEL